MDFLDPKKRRAHKIRLLLGYGLIGIAIAAATTILLYQAYGFGLDKNGQVIQKGLVYVSSQPGGAGIYVNGKLADNTNTRLNLQAGQYNVALKRDGYRDWQHDITVEGGTVIHYDYPFLFPVNLKTAAKQTFEAAPLLTTESPDRRWLLIGQKSANDASLQITQYDLKNPTQAATNFSLPLSISSINPKQDSWEVTDWSNDNQHVLLKHSFDGGYEYVLLNRDTPADSINLTKTLTGPAPQIQLQNKKYDSYVIYDPATQVLSTASLKAPTPQTWVAGVLAFQTYDTDTVLYATTTGIEDGKASIRLRQGDQTYSIRTVLSGSQYVLNLTKYSNQWIVAVGASIEDKVYVYVNPINSLQATPRQVLVPITILRVAGTNTLTFSANARFIMAENGSNFAVYDAENDKTYTYALSAGLDAPQTKVSWMDGHRLTYVSGGKLVVVDFDNTNAQSLMPANANYLPLFDTAYKYAYTLANDSNGKLVLTSTPLLIDKDL